MHTEAKFDGCYVFIYILWSKFLFRDSILYQMNAKSNLIIALSFFGLVAGILNVNAILTDYQWLFWLAYYVLAGIIFAKKITKRLFLHAFAGGFLFAAFFYIMEILSISQLLENNAAEREILTHLPDGLSPRTYLISVGMITAVISGAIMGLVSMGFARFIKKNTPPQSL